MKYVFITGGVVSSLGKGLTAASLGRLLRARGYRVSLHKLDVYYNVEPGFLSPLEHGEVFITEDGTATDLDLGHYERFVDINLTGKASSTTGKIHESLIAREMRGDFHGSTIQAIPHVTNEIKSCIREAGQESEIAIVEIGGTVGDMEAAVYLEAIRQMRWECEKPNDCCYVHVTLMPYIATAGELKTKPTQSSVKELRSIGIQPDIIVCRTEVPMTDDAKDKIALFCNVKKANVIQNADVDSLYDLPLVLEEEGLSKTVLAELGLPEHTPDLEDWRAMVRQSKAPTDSLKVALVGKYNAVPDAYLSVYEALHHAGFANGLRCAINAVSAEDLREDSVGPLLHGHAAIVVPGGFGVRGSDGILLAARYARENRIPFLAIGYGMQLAVVEAARNLLGIGDAHTTEVNPSTKHPLVRIPEDRICQNDSRSAARLGAGDVKLLPGMVRDTYGRDVVRERHSNRYEIDQDYARPLAGKGFHLVGTSMDAGYPEVFELDGHPFYVGVIFHPEYISRPNRPHPLFSALIARAKALKPLSD